MNNPAIPQKNISHRNSPAPLVRIDIRRLALLFVSEAPRSLDRTLQFQRYNNVSIRVAPCLLTPDS